MAMKRYSTLPKVPGLKSPIMWFSCYILLVAIRISVTKVIQYIYKCRYKYNTNTINEDSVVQVRTVLLISWLQFIDTRRETQFLKVFRNHTILTPPQGSAHLVVFKTSVCRDPKNLTATNTVENLTLCPNDRNLIVWSNVSFQLTPFQNPQILRTISSRYDVIYTPATFPVCSLLWQWGLSYPLRASIKLHLMTMPWTKRLE